MREAGVWSDTLMPITASRGRALKAAANENRESRCYHHCFSSVKRPGGNREMRDADGVARLVEVVAGAATSCVWLANESSGVQLKMCLQCVWFVELQG